MFFFKLKSVVQELLMLHNTRIEKNGFEVSTSGPVDLTVTWEVLIECSMPLD